MEWFARFPALFAFIGVIAGTAISSVVAWIMFKRYGNAMAGAHEEVAAAAEKVSAQLERQVKVLEHSLVLQKESFDRTLEDMKQAALATRAHYEREVGEWKAALAGMTAERDGYRDKLHDANGQLHSCSLKIAEMEARPNVDQLFKAETEWNQQREKFYVSISDSQKGIIDLITKVDKKLEDESKRHREELQEYSQVCHKTAQAMDALVTRLTIDGIIPSANETAGNRADRHITEASETAPERAQRQRSENRG